MLVVVVVVVLSALSAPSQMCSRLRTSDHHIDNVDGHNYFYCPSRVTMTIRCLGLFIGLWIIQIARMLYQRHTSYHVRR